MITWEGLRSLPSLEGIDMTVMLYKYPGPHSLHGDKFDYIVVNDDGVDNALKDGWAKTTDEAKAGTEKSKPLRKTKAKEE
jgi:hypothetical protein